MVKILSNKVISMLFLIATTFISLSAIAAQPPTPLRTYAQSPEQSTHLTTELRSAFPVGNHGVELFASGTMASVWASSDTADLDYYQNHIFVGANWQVNPQLQTEVKYQYTYAANNHLDSLTMDFHSFFGIGQNGRDEAGKHQFHISSDEYGVSIDDFEGEALAKALHWYTQYQLFSSNTSALAIGGSVYYKNVDSGPFKKSAFEQAVQLNYSLARGASSFFASAGVTHNDNNSALIGTEIRDFTGAVAFGYGYKFGYFHEVLVEYHWYQGLLEDEGAFSEASNEVVLGYRLNLGNAMLEASMIENIINMDNSADIAFGLGIRYFL
ncbi:hypothetical protein BCT81_01740 [Vibrio sp. 10N.261.52.A1]|nr:DUF3187 family protein [Vibrio sp. 10N.261.52.A1]PML51644.1 hypothetical protein BCT81_01740 [Vibrio sp. 10N.261.52.A1]